MAFLVYYPIRTVGSACSVYKRCVCIYTLLHNIKLSHKEKCENVVTGHFHKGLCATTIKKSFSK